MQHIPADGEYSGEIEIINIATDTQQRKKGFANALLHHLIQYAEQNNYNKIFLDVCESNTPALTLYKKNGFKEIGRRKNYYTDEKNPQNKKDALLMMLEIDQVKGKSEI